MLLTGSQLPFFINYGGDGPVSAKLVCGYLACDAQPFNPLLDNLPPVIKAGDKGRRAGWLGQFIRLAMMESADKRAGGESVLARLSELMFIEVIRRHLEALPPEQAGWLAGLRDPFVGKALSLMHGWPAITGRSRSWPRRSALSRSVLAERFADLVGIPPMQYLAKWRMQIASGLLSGGNANIATVAAEIGYGSEAAFSRAFKKMVGMPPSAWRRRLDDDGSRRNVGPPPQSSGSETIALGLVPALQCLTGKTHSCRLLAQKQTAGPTIVRPVPNLPEGRPGVIALTRGARPMWALGLLVSQGSSSAAPRKPDLHYGVMH